MNYSTCSLFFTNCSWTLCIHINRLWTGYLLGYREKKIGVQSKVIVIWEGRARRVLPCHTALRLLHLPIFLSSHNSRPTKVFSQGTILMSISFNLHQYFCERVIRNSKRGVVPVRQHHKCCLVTRSRHKNCKALMPRQAITLDTLPLVSASIAF